LDVVSFGQVFAMSAVAMDLPFHRVKIRDSGEVEIFAAHERRYLMQDRFTDRNIASAGTGLYHGRPLPVLTDIFVIEESRFNRNRNCGGGRVRAQTQICPKHIPVDGTLLQQSYEPLRDAHK